MKEKILRISFLVICWAIILYILLPIIVLIVNSFNKSKFFEFPPTGFSLQWFEKFLVNKEYQASLLVSVKIAAVSAFSGILIGTPAAYAIKRYNFKGSNLLQTFFLSPLMLPSVVWALGLIQYMNVVRIGNASILGTFFGLISAHTVIILPYVIRMVMTSLSYMDKDLESASLSLGANPIKTFFGITFPLISPGVLVGAVFGFMVSFTDVVVTSFIGGSKYITFPVRMYSEIRSEGLDPLAVAVSAIIIIILVIVSFICEKTIQWSRYI
jgi:putative spermidine/putrescine transport system permease protein